VALIAWRPGFLRTALAVLIIAAAWPAGYFAAFATDAALTKPGAPFAGQEVLAARIALGLVGSTIGTLLVIGALALAARGMY
ncbi:hypothetical protein KC219_26220, partial [Mycobacterium tuberculosis]|nr:hypothetical protein [Mycobacterium tuberculosis]